jgi:hypothetical protein
MKQGCRVDVVQVSCNVEQFVEEARLGVKVQQQPLVIHVVEAEDDAGTWIQAKSGA